MKKYLLSLALLALPLVAHAAVLGAAATDTTAVLTWTASATAGSTVNVYRCAGASCTSFAKITTGVAAGGPYTDTSVTAGSYTYYVTAVVNGAESVPSNTATVTISPLPPTGLTAVAQ